MTDSADLQPVAGPTPEPGPAPGDTISEKTVPTGTASPQPDVPGEDGLHLIEPEQPLPPVGLADLPAVMQAAAARAGWTELVPVQARAIPYLRSGRDIMVQSKTGSGKTGAFILPILEQVDPQKACCQALVLVPTRELCQQVTQQAELLGAGSGMRVISVYGGVGYGPQLDAFRLGAHLVVGTPGRLLDHLLRGSLKLDGLRVLIFDEADRLMSMGFYPDMREIAGYLPRHRTAFMFSATFPPGVQKLAGQFLRQPGFLSLSRDAVHALEIEHYLYEMPAMDKDRALVRIIELENPDSAIIFCNTKMRVNYVATVLQRFGYDADQLSADLSQVAREKVLARLRDHSLRFLVATDLAARGLDIVNLSHIFNYETPEDPEAYIHRTGRTGRAGASGIAISLVSFMEKTNLQLIARRFKIHLEERPLPTPQDVEAMVAQRLTALLEAKLRHRDRLQVERMQRFQPLARGLAESEEGLALLTMLLDDHYQQSLHAIPSLAPEEKLRPPLRTRDERPPAGDSSRRRRRRR